MGASGGHLVRQVLIESVMFGAIGGGLGLGARRGRHPRAAGAGARRHPADRGRRIRRVRRLAHACCSPCWCRWGRAWWSDCFRRCGPRASMSNRTCDPEATGRGAGPSHERTRALLVATQVALACMLLVGTTLLIRSFVEMHRVQPGFDSARVLTMTTMTTEARYASTEATTSAGRGERPGGAHGAWCRGGGRDDDRRAARGGKDDAADRDCRTNRPQP